MVLQKTTFAACLLVVTGALGACGGGSSSSQTASDGAAGAPTNASTDAFCTSFTELGSKVTPKEAADKLRQVGTPSGIPSGARHGFELLVDHLETLPDNADQSDISKLVQGMQAGDQTDLTSFVTYFTTTCINPSAPPS